MKRMHGAVRFQNGIGKHQGHDVGKLFVLSVHFKPGDGLFLLRNINHYQLNGNAHLGSRQANALCCVHGFQHIFRQGFQAVVKMFYRAAFFLQYRISILCYFQ